jgi:tetratricopeptide (TPR) repeat protein
VVTVLWAALRAFALGASPIGASRIVGNLDALIVYLGKTLLPVGLSVVPHPADSSLVPGIVASVLLLAAVGLTWRRLFGPPGLGLLWYGAALAPTLLVPAQTWGLEQRIYLPMVGMLLFVAWIPAPGGLALSPRVGPALAVAVAIVFGVQSARRLPELADGTAFWESAVATSPSSALAGSRLAWRYYEERRFSDMDVAVDRVLALDPDDGEMYLLRGIVAGNAGDRSAAEGHFRRAVDLEPNNADAWENLGKLQKLQRRWRESKASLRRAEELRAR